MNNFTLIVPTHNRHHFLKRSIEYFKNLQADVIYCDSSIEKYEGFLYDNTKYIHLPNIGFAEKISLALTNINTDFVAFCADDDFIIINSLYRGADFLSQHRNFKCFVGKYIGFNEDFDGNFFPIYQKLPEDIDFGFEMNTVVFFNNYYQILWAMYDKNVIEKVYRIINQAKFYNENYIELTIGSFLCYAGGIKFINEIWGVREITKQEHWGNRHEPIVNIKIAKVNNDFNKFKELVDSNTFDGCADLSMNNYFNGQKKKAVSLKYFIGKIFPIFIKKEIRRWLYTKETNSIVGLDQISREYLNPIVVLLNKGLSSK